MIITYRKSDNLVISIVEGFPNVWEENGQLLIEGGSSPLLNDLATAAWGRYQDMPVERLYDANGVALPLYLGDLDLSPIAAGDLPRSMHIAALTAVDVATKRGTVVRRWLGSNYTYTDCRVSLQALEAYQCSKLKVFDPAYAVTAPENVDCFVLVYFVSENPFDEEIEIPVVVDKVVK